MLNGDRVRRIIREQLRQEIECGADDWFTSGEEVPVEDLISHVRPELGRRLAALDREDRFEDGSAIVRRGRGGEPRVFLNRVSRNPISEDYAGIDEDALRRMVRGWIELDEGVFSGVGTTTAPEAVPSSERSAIQNQSKIAAQRSLTAAKGALPQDLGVVRSKVAGMKKDELLKLAQDYVPSKDKEDPLAKKYAVGAFLRLVGDKMVPPADINRIAATNPALVAAISSTRGGSDLEKSVEATLTSVGKNPTQPKKISPGEMWSRAADVVKKTGIV